MRCPKCRNKLLQKSDDGSSRLRTEGPITFAADGSAQAKCYWCKSETTLPITIKAEPKLVLGKA